MNSKPLPQVGTRGSFSVGSDRYPCTVIAVSPSGSRVTVQEDRVTVYTPYPDCWGDEIERNPEGRTMVFTRRQNGRYRQTGGGSLSLDGWMAYQDPSF